MPAPAVSGFLVVDKTVGPNSRDVVNRALTFFPRHTRVGHCGTLDPLASGVLVLAIGRATRLVTYVQDQPKTYETTITFGATSATDDAAGPIAPMTGAETPELAQVEAALRAQTGVFPQVPPAFSAIHVEGRRAHQLARSGRDFALPARPVLVERIELLHYAYPELTLRIDCGKGTYIRSMARDLGVTLGCGGYVSALRRTRVGVFSVEAAVDLERPGVVPRAHLLPLREAAAQLPSVTLTEAECVALRHGQTVIRPELPHGLELAALSAHGELVALVRVSGAVLRPEKVIPATPAGLA